MSHSRTPNKKNTPLRNKKKRPRSDDDREFKPGRDCKRRKTNHHTDVLHLRTNNASTVMVDGIEQPIKTAVSIDEKSIKGLSPTRLKKHLSFTDIKTDRPIAQIITSNSLSPIAVTPFGSKLRKKSRLGICTLFSNEPCVKQLTFDTPPISDQKQQEIRLTEKSIHEAQAKLRKNHGQRSTSQNAIMARTGIEAAKGSAEQYVKAANIVQCDCENIKCDWLHLIAYSFLGETAQDVANLVAASANTNTLMMSAEASAKQLAKLYPEGVKISVLAKLITDSHIANKINYTITTPDFSLTFNFDGFDPNKPLYAVSTYVKQMLEACIKASEEQRTSLKIQEKENVKPANSVTRQSLFRQAKHANGKQTQESKPQLSMVSS